VANHNNPNHRRPPRRLWTPDELAGVLRCSISCLNKWRVKGIGPPFVKLDGRILYDEDDVNAFIASRRFASTSAADAAVTVEAV